MIRETRHVGIVVQDLEKCLAFWRDVMGLEVTVDFREEGDFIDTIQHLEGVSLRPPGKMGDMEQIAGIAEKLRAAL